MELGQEVVTGIHILTMLFDSYVAFSAVNSYAINSGTVWKDF